MIQNNPSRVTAILISRHKSPAVILPQLDFPLVHHRKLPSERIEPRFFRRTAEQKYTKNKKIKKSQ